MTDAQADPRIRDAVVGFVVERMRTSRRRPWVLGICGAQGSGKSTLTAALVEAFGRYGLPTASLSLDDLYKTKADRLSMARLVHPIFATRGVPGTHDVALGQDLIADLELGLSAAIPRFDKAIDDRAPPDTWGESPAGTELLILEGWCVGARPPVNPLPDGPINSLEARHDPDGTWRRSVSRALAQDYASLFGRLDGLVFLRAPGFYIVHQWRLEQEHRLRADTGGGMRDEDIAHFIEHYERMTREILAEMPGYADLVVHLDEQRRPGAIDLRNNCNPLTRGGTRDGGSAQADADRSPRKT